MYRLRGAGPNRENVIAKQAGLERIRLEHWVYEEVLPRVLLATIGCYGSIVRSARCAANHAAWRSIRSRAGAERASP